MRSSAVARSDYVEQLRQLLASEYYPDSPTHDLTHLARVASLAAQLCAAEGGDELIVTAAAWLHDLHRDKKPSTGSFFVRPEATDERVICYLSKTGLPKPIYPEILEAIHYTDRFSFSDRSTYRVSVNARIVRDADCLDAIGAIGVARAFAFGGAHDIPLWDGRPIRETAMYRQSERPPSTMQHFHDKLLRLADDLDTEAAKKIAVRRKEFLEEFSFRFMDEWTEDMLDSGEARLRDL